MKNKKKMVVAGTVFLAGLIICFAEEPPIMDIQPQQMNRERYGKGLASKLGLSDETAAEIRTKMHDTRITMIKLKSERDVAKTELEYLMKADSVDESAVLKAADKLAQVTGDILKTRVKARLDTLKMLTPEQRKQMQELRQQMKNRRGQRLSKRKRSGDRSKQRAPNQPRELKRGEPKTDLQ